MYVAAFAVSAYACSFTRAGGKPFNPVLGETYECLRPDRGFRFISEQVTQVLPLFLIIWDLRSPYTHSLTLHLIGQSPSTCVCLSLRVQELHTLAR